MKINIFTILFLFFLSNVFAQNIIADELIVRLHPDVASSDFEQSINQQRNFSASDIEFQSIGPSWNMHKLTVDKRDAPNLIDALQTHPDVASVGYNFQVKPRELTPNDALYNELWDLDVIKAPEVWELTTGGVNALGDTIVIANLEYTDLDHEDLVDNIWINHNEIPNNGIDDDDNGYFDDYRGYNVIFQDDSVDNDFLLTTDHGTQTSGIMAARGNNNIGVTGVSWNVKLMVVSSTLIFDDIVESYQYILDMRQLYNSTDGAKGAFIVATNASFGIKAFPEDEPVYMEWCEIYNSLGEAGVLNVGATSNANEDIDFEGDMPTSCQSEYLISVTNINEANMQRGGFSTVNIDLGAPGSEVTTTAPFDSYKTIGGTSSAAPHVTGAIGLLYSANCEKLAILSKENPAASALLMKEFILSGTAPLADLQDKTVTGGLLNLKNSFDLIQNYCGSSTGPLEVLKVKTNIERQEISVDYQTPAAGPYTVRIYDAVGRLVADSDFELEVFDPRTFILDVSRFATGVYFLSIENNENIKSRSFVVYE